MLAGDVPGVEGHAVAGREHKAVFSPSSASPKLPHLPLAMASEGFYGSLRQLYGPLTATLVAIYFGAIVLLQGLLVALTGQKSTLAVVASTLIIATLFNPLRRRIQSFIDHRFYRRKYDARKAFEAFSDKLRDETDLEALNHKLVGVVRDTMQPAHVSLWLRHDSNGQRDG